MPDQRTVLAAKLTLASRFSKTMAGLDVKVRSVLQPLDGCCSPSRRNRPSRSELLGQEARPGADPFSGDGPIEDDILLRALEGDTEAASALQERQQQRRQKLKEQAAAAPASARRPPVALAPAAAPAAAAAKPPPPSHWALLDYALSGACTWLATERGRRELFMTTKKEEPSTLTLLDALHERRATTDNLQSTLAQRDDAVRQAAQGLEAMKAEYEALQAQRRKELPEPEPEILVEDTPVILDAMDSFAANITPVVREEGRSKKDQ